MNAVNIDTPVAHARIASSPVLPAHQSRDPEIQVRPVGKPDEWRTWNISQNLTDRWGDLNYAFSAEKPLETLEQDEALLARLRNQMWDEISFVVRKDGRYGILFEVEYCSIESEAPVRDGDTMSYKPHAEMIQIINHATLEKLVPNFPGVEFAIPHEDEIVQGRPALWAYVADGLLDEVQREALGQAMLEL